MNKIYTALLAIITVVAAYNLYQSHTIGADTQRAFATLVEVNKNVLEQNAKLAEQNTLLRQQLARR